MPERDFIRHAKTYYLDTSTLSYAHRAARGDLGYPPEFAALVPWIERVSVEANLCLSFAHVAELSGWQPEADANSCVEWIDALPFVWVVGFDLLDQVEAEHALKVALGLGVSSAFRPFRRKGRGFAEMVRVARQAGWAPLQELPSKLTELIRGDIAAMNAEAVTDAQLAEKRAYRTRRALCRMADEVYVGLVRRRDPACIQAQMGRRAIRNRFVALYERDPTVLRFFRAANAAVRDLGENAAVRKPGSRREREQLAGASADQLHVMAGGCYCDVFTCDRRTAEWVAPLRKQFGLTAPITSANKAPADFVRALLAASGS